jgi:hypothetical protein
MTPVDLVQDELRDSLEKISWELQVDFYSSQLEARGLHPVGAHAVHLMEKDINENI